MAYGISTDALQMNVKYSAEDVQAYKIGDNVKIRCGEFVQIDPATGFAVPLIKAVSALFAGIAMETVDNTVTGHTAGGKPVRVRTTGVVLRKATGLVQADVGKKVWASTETADAQNTVIVSDPGATATPVGVIVEYVSATRCRIDISGYAGKVWSDAS